MVVVDLFGKPLMPTNEYRARKLLKQKKARFSAIVRLRFS